jgi:hypothetical protein
VTTSRELKFDPSALADQAVAFEFNGYLRAMLLAHRATPLRIGFGKTRFASPDDGFKVLYAAESLAETPAQALAGDGVEVRVAVAAAAAQIERCGVPTGLAPTENDALLQGSATC